MWYDDIDDFDVGMSDSDRALYLLYIIKCRGFVVSESLAADIKLLLDKYDNNIYKGGF